MRNLYGGNPRDDDYAGDPIWFWGTLGVVWGGCWGLLLGGAALDSRPLWGYLVDALVGSAVIGGFSALISACRRWPRRDAPDQREDDQSWPGDYAVSGPSQRRPGKDRISAKFRLPGERRRSNGLRATSLRLR